MQPTAPTFRRSTAFPPTRLTLYLVLAAALLGLALEQGPGPRDSGTHPRGGVSTHRPA